MSYARLAPRVLIMEEHRNMRSILRTVLRGFDIRKVDETDNTDDAIAVLESKSVDVVISEFIMREGTATGFIKKIRKFDTNPHRFVPIVACTASTTLTDIRAMIDAGVDEVMQKPISAVQVIRRMDSALSVRRTFIRTKTFFGPDRRRADLTPDFDDRRVGASCARVETPNVHQLREMMKVHFAQMSEF